MAHPKNEALKISKRRAEVAALYLQGRYQWEIAESVKVDRGTVSRDLAAIHEQWKASGVHDLDAAKAKELERIDNLERTYWLAWERSLEDRETTSTEKATGGEGADRLKAAVRKEGRDGNPTFLAGVQWCINKRCDLLGLDAPKRSEFSGPKGTAIQHEVKADVNCKHTLSPEATRAFHDDLVAAGLGDVPAHRNGKHMDQEGTDPPG